MTGTMNAAAVTLLTLKNRSEEDELLGILAEFTVKAKEIAREVIDRLKQIKETILVAIAIQGVGQYNKTPREEGLC
ncbi:MAG: hypothetical protein WAM14_09825 [Candidatus Nitrosopolaris sp.]